MVASCFEITRVGRDYILQYFLGNGADVHPEILNAAIL